MTTAQWGVNLTTVNFEAAQNERWGAAVPRGTPVLLMYKFSWWSSKLSAVETEWGLIRPDSRIKAFAFPDTEVGRDAAVAIGRWARGR